MAEHGFLKPNPALLSDDLDKRKKRFAHLAHELGAGAKCLKCGDGCAGFQLHYWRYVSILKPLDIVLSRNHFLKKIHATYRTRLKGGHQVW